MEVEQNSTIHFVNFTTQDMANNQDIRWLQRFSNYNKALTKLNDIISYIQQPTKNTEDIVDEINRQALIQSFEYNYELAWNVMKDYIKYQGKSDIGGPRDAIREALTMQLIDDGKVWMEMIASRNKTSHTYNESVANQIFQKIIKDYQAAFVAFQSKMEEKRTGRQLDLL